MYDGSNITSKVNASNPKINGPCYTLHSDSRNSLVILNDQGGSVMSVSDDVVGCLRAQDHGHSPVVCFVECVGHSYISDETAQTVRAECHGAIPVICFEPGIVKRECGTSRFVVDRCGTLRANMGDNQPAVCYVAKRFAEYSECLPTLRASGGDIGCGSEGLIVYESVSEDNR